MTKKPKPCPFCGKASELQVPENDDVVLAVVMCLSCYCCGAEFFTDKEAIKAWDTRSDDWQPIETAPKDGTKVMVWRPDCDFHHPHAAFDVYENEAWHRSRPSAQPTYWKPLPAPPQEDE